MQSNYASWNIDLHSFPYSKGIEEQLKCQLLPAEWRKMPGEIDYLLKMPFNKGATTLGHTFR